jgi:formyl-CoA transferase
VNEAMRALLANFTIKDAIAHFTRHDVVAAPVNTIAQAAQDPHPWERGALVEVPDFLAGKIAVSGDFWHFSRTPAVVGSTPKVGEHNEEVLGSLLGYSGEEIATLYANHVIGNWDHYGTLPG